MNILGLLKIATRLSIGTSIPRRLQYHPVTTGTIRCDSGHRISGQQVSKIHNWSGVFRHRRGVH